MKKIPIAYHQLQAKQFPHRFPGVSLFSILVVSLFSASMLVLPFFFPHQNAGNKLDQAWSPHDLSAKKTHLAYWQRLIEKNPMLRDAWLEVARYQYMVNEVQMAQNSLAHALAIDPNYPPAQAFHAFLATQSAIR